MQREQRRLIELQRFELVDGLEASHEGDSPLYGNSKLCAKDTRGTSRTRGNPADLGGPSSKANNSLTDSEHTGKVKSTGREVK